MGKIKKSIKDLGMAAYLKLHGFDLHKKEGRFYIFMIEEGQNEEFEAMKVDYINGPFYKFDTEIMSLKML